MSEDLCSDPQREEKENCEDEETVKGENTRNLTPQISVEVDDPKEVINTQLDAEENEDVETEDIETEVAISNNSTANVTPQTSIEVEDQKSSIEKDPQKLILWAAEKNEVETMRTLLEGDPNLVNTRDNDMYTPLHRAAYSNNVEVMKLLLSYNADITSETVDGWSALHCACKWDNVEAASLLLQNGADVNAQTHGHVTPMHLAASNVSGRQTLELLLWQMYIDPNVKNDAGDTAYDIACRTGPLGALFEILEESVNVY